MRSADAGARRRARRGTLRRASPTFRPGRRPEGEVAVRTLEVGVCGTDREIADGLFGVAPGRTTTCSCSATSSSASSSATGTGSRAAISSRRSCAARAGTASRLQRRRPRLLPDGRLQRARDHAPARVRARAASAEDPAQLIAIPRSLGRLGVLVEPTSICERAIRHARSIGGRQPWELQRALVVGAGAIGMLSTVPPSPRRSRGLDGVARGRRTTACAARRLGRALRLDADRAAARCRDEVGGFDLVVEATGDAQVMADSIGLLRRSGVACLLGARRAARRPSSSTGASRRRRHPREPRPLRQRQRPPARLARRRRVARPRTAALAGRARVLRRLRVPLDRFAEAFAHPGVKATLVLDASASAQRPPSVATAPVSFAVAFDRDSARPGARSATKIAPSAARRADAESPAEAVDERHLGVDDQVVPAPSCSADLLGGRERPSRLLGGAGRKGAGRLGHPGAVGAVHQAAEHRDPERAAELARDVVDGRRDALLLGRERGDDRGRRRARRRAPCRRRTAAGRRGSASTTSRRRASRGARGRSPSAKAGRAGDPDAEPGGDCRGDARERDHDERHRHSAPAAWSGEKPITSWRYGRARNRKPNIAKNWTVTESDPAPKPRRRKCRGSSIGSRRRSSHATNATRAGERRTASDGDGGRRSSHARGPR